MAFNASYDIFDGADAVNLLLCRHFILVAGRRRQHAKRNVECQAAARVASYIFAFLARLRPMHRWLHVIAQVLRYRRPCYRYILFCRPSASHTARISRRRREESGLICHTPAKLMNVDAQGVYLFAFSPIIRLPLSCDSRLHDSSKHLPQMRRSAAIVASRMI